MLNGIFQLLSQQPLPVDEIKNALQTYDLSLDNLQSVSGSFKTVYALSHDIALASVKAINKEMLSKEKVLLAKLAEIGLPAITYYSDVFECQGNRQAVLLQWIPDAILIDVKDFEAAQRKLMLAALGIDLPVSGEAWVLHKNETEKSIRQLFSNNPKLFMQVVKFAQLLHPSLLHIINILENNALAIADLQLLVTKD